MSYDTVSDKIICIPSVKTAQYNNNAIGCRNIDLGGSHWSIGEKLKHAAKSVGLIRTLFHVVYLKSSLSMFP